MNKRFFSLTIFCLVTAVAWAGDIISSQSQWTFDNYAGQSVWQGLYLHSGEAGVFGTDADHAKSHSGTFTGTTIDWTAQQVLTCSQGVADAFSSLGSREADAADGPTGSLAFNYGGTGYLYILYGATSKADGTFVVSQKKDSETAYTTIYEKKMMGMAYSGVFGARDKAAMTRGDDAVETVFTQEEAVIRLTGSGSVYLGATQPYCVYAVCYVPDPVVSRATIVFNREKSKTDKSNAVYTATFAEGQTLYYKRPGQDETFRSQSYKADYATNSFTITTTNNGQLEYFTMETIDGQKYYSDTLAVIVNTIAKKPTATFKNVDGEESVYTVSFTEGTVLYYTVPGGTEQTVASGAATEIKVAQSGQLLAYSKTEAVTSDTLKTTVYAPTPAIEEGGTYDFSKLNGKMDADISPIPLDGTVTVGGETLYKSGPITAATFGSNFAFSNSKDWRLLKSGRLRANKNSDGRTDTLALLGLKKGENIGFTFTSNSVSLRYISATGTATLEGNPEVLENKKYYRVASDGNMLLLLRTDTVTYDITKVELGAVETVTAPSLETVADSPNKVKITPGKSSMGNTVTTYYTTDGTTPSTESTSITKTTTITIYDNCTVKAYTISDGGAVSDVSELAVTYVAPTVVAPAYTLNTDKSTNTRAVYTVNVQKGEKLGYLRPGDTEPRTSSYKEEGIEVTVQRNGELQLWAQVTDGDKVYTSDTVTVVISSLVSRPTASFTRVEGVTSIYTLTFMEGNTLHYTVPGGTEQVVGSGTTTEIKVTQSGQLIAYGKTESATSDTLKTTVYAPTPAIEEGGTYDFSKLNGKMTTDITLTFDSTVDVGGYTFYKPNALTAATFGNNFAFNKGNDWRLRSSGRLRANKSEHTDTLAILGMKAGESFVFDLSNKDLQLQLIAADGTATLANGVTTLESGMVYNVETDGNLLLLVDATGDNYEFTQISLGVKTVERSTPAGYDLAKMVSDDVSTMQFTSDTLKVYVNELQTDGSRSDKLRNFVRVASLDGKVSVREGASSVQVTDGLIRITRPFAIHDVAPGDEILIRYEGGGELQNATYSAGNKFSVNGAPVGAGSTVKSGSTIVVTQSSYSNNYIVLAPSGKCLITAIYINKEEVVDDETATHFYISPDGSDDNRGTVKSSPFKTLKKALERVPTGGVVHILPGIYQVTNEECMDKTDVGRDVVYLLDKSDVEYVGEVDGDGRRPIFNFSGMTHGEGKAVIGFLIPTAVKNIVIRNIEAFGINGNNQSEFFCLEGALGCQLNNLSAYQGKGSGFSIIGNSKDNLIQNCDAYENGEDGFGCHVEASSEGNRFVESRAWGNAHNGFDISDSRSVVVIEDCIAYANGHDSMGSGFAFGSPSEASLTSIPAHETRRCIAADNEGAGFDASNYPGSLLFERNRAYMNGCDYKLMTGYEHILTGNLSYGNTEISKVIAGVDPEKCLIEGNSFNYTDGEWKNQMYVKTDFVSTDIEVLSSARDALGSLASEVWQFLELLNASADVADPVVTFKAVENEINIYSISYPVDATLYYQLPNADDYVQTTEGIVANGTKTYELQVLASGVMNCYALEGSRVSAIVRNTIYAATPMPQLEVVEEGISMTIVTNTTEIEQAVTDSYYILNDAKGKKWNGKSIAVSPGDVISAYNLNTVIKTASDTCTAYTVPKPLVPAPVVTLNEEQSTDTKKVYTITFAEGTKLCYLRPGDEKTNSSSYSDKNNGAIDVTASRNGVLTVWAERTVSKVVYSSDTLTIDVSGIVAKPKVALNRIDGNNSIYTITFLEGTTLGFMLPGGEEGSVGEGSSVDVTISQSGRLKAWTNAGEAVSDTLNTNVYAPTPSAVSGSGFDFSLISTMGADVTMTFDGTVTAAGKTMLTPSEMTARTFADKLAFTNHNTTWSLLKSGRLRGKVGDGGVVDTLVIRNVAAGQNIAITFSNNNTTLTAINAEGAARLEAGATTISSGTYYSITVSGDLLLALPADAGNYDILKIEFAGAETVDAPTILKKQGTENTVIIRRGYSSLGYDATTYYTTDGSTPSLSSDSFTKDEMELTINKSGVIKAFTVSSSGLQSSITTFTLTLPEPEASDAKAINLAAIVSSGEQLSFGEDKLTIYVSEESDGTWNDKKRTDFVDITTLDNKVAVRNGGTTVADGAIRFTKAFAIKDLAVGDEIIIRYSGGGKLLVATPEMGDVVTVGGSEATHGTEVPTGTVIRVTKTSFTDNYVVLMPSGKCVISGIFINHAEVENVTAPTIALKNDTVPNVVRLRVGSSSMGNEVTIRYTVDGSKPSATEGQVAERSPLDLTLNTDCLIRAVTVSSSGAVSEESVFQVLLPMAERSAPVGYQVEDILDEQGLLEFSSERVAVYVSEYNKDNDTWETKRRTDFVPVSTFDGKISIRGGEGGITISDGRMRLTRALAIHDLGIGDEIIIDYTGDGVLQSAVCDECDEFTIDGVKAPAGTEIPSLGVIRVTVSKYENNYLVFMPSGRVYINGIYINRAAPGKVSMPEVEFSKVTDGKAVYTITHEVGSQLYYLLSTDEEVFAGTTEGQYELTVDQSAVLKAWAMRDNLVSDTLMVTVYAPTPAPTEEGTLDFAEISEGMTMDVEVTLDQNKVVEVGGVTLYKPTALTAATFDDRFAFSEVTKKDKVKIRTNRQLEFAKGDDMAMAILNLKKGDILAMDFTGSIELNGELLVSGEAYHVADDSDVLLNLRLKDAKVDITKVVLTRPAQPSSPAAIDFAAAYDDYEILSMGQSVTVFYGGKSGGQKFEKILNACSTLPIDGKLSAEAGSGEITVDGIKASNRRIAIHDLAVGDSVRIRFYGGAVTYAGHESKGDKTRLGERMLADGDTLSTGDVIVVDKVDYLNNYIVLKLDSKVSISAIFINKVETERVWAPTITDNGKNSIVITAGRSSLGNKVNTCYTTDGTEPTEDNGTSGPYDSFDVEFLGGKMMQVKAVSYTKGGAMSEVTSLIIYADELLGIEEVLRHEKLARDGSEAIYDLNGRRVQQMKQGQLYIVNGKKIFFK